MCAEIRTGIAITALAKAHVASSDDFDLVMTAVAIGGQNGAISVTGERTWASTCRNLDNLVQKHVIAHKK